MVKYKLELLVGLFIIFSLCSLFIIMFKFTNMIGAGSVGKTYKVKAIFRNIGSLKIKAKVSIYGVKVGYVDKIKLVRNSLNEYYAELDMLIDVNITCIPKDSTASIFMVNLLGDNYVQIDLGNDDDFLKAGDTIFLTNQALIIEDLIAKFAFNK